MNFEIVEDKMLQNNSREAYNPIATGGEMVILQKWTIKRTNNFRKSHTKSHRNFLRRFQN